MQDSFKEFVLEQLRYVPNVSARSMFGGFGLYAGSRFFGIISGDRLYFKTNSKTAPAFKERGMGPFRASDTQILKNYYEVPPDVLEDADELSRWAETARTLEK